MLDPNNPETWVNKNLPVDQSLQAELTKVGGTVPEGGYAGKPIYRLAFGQTETEYLGGRERIRFRDARIPRLARVSRFFISPSLLQDWSAYVAKNPMVDEYGIYKKRTTLAQFLSESGRSFEYTALETVTIPEKEYRKNAHLPNIAAPSSWLFVSEIEELISIGRDCWYVLRWIPAADYEKRESWERHRYEYGAYIPEIGATVPVLDFNGPYPEHGVYTAFLEIADYPTGSWKDYRYCAPTFSTAVQPVIDTIEQRLTAEEKSIREATSFIDTAFEQMDEFDKQEEVWDQFATDAAPQFAGKPRKWANEPSKFIHRDVKTSGSNLQD